MNHLAVAQGIPIGGDRPVHIPAMLVRIRADTAAHIKTLLAPLGSRIAEVHNGSSLFTGDAGQGESNIRRWIIENDWLEAIVALPFNMFYNTGSAHAPACTRRCRSSNRSSSPSPYAFPRHPIHPGSRIPPQGVISGLQSFRRNVMQECSQTFLRVSLGCLPYPVRRRRHTSPALRPARGLAWLLGFSLVEPLCSANSAEGRPPLFASLIARTGSSDFFISFIIRFSFLFPHAAPSTRNNMKTSQGPGRRRADVLGFFDTAGLSIPSPMRGWRCCLQPL